MNWWLVLRLVGVAVGIVTILGFASGYLNVEFQPVFTTVLKVLQEGAAVIVGAPLWEMALDWLRQHFAWVPKPEPHWKPLYTLSALLMLSLARRLWWYAIPLALACSLIPAIAAGNMPVGSFAVIAWPLAGFLAFMAILALPRGEWRDTLQFAAGAAAVAALSYFLWGTTHGSSPLGTSPFVVLATFVGLFGLIFLVVGLRDAEGTLWQRLQDDSVAIGLDITGTLGGALALGYLFAA